MRVMVFSERRKRGWSHRAYTVWANPKWNGCCVHEINVKSGTEAKKLAIEDHKQGCVLVDSGITKL